MATADDEIELLNWFRCHLERLKRVLPAATFADGEVDRLWDLVDEEDDEAEDFVQSLTACVLHDCAQESKGVHAVVASTFAWYGKGDDEYDVDRLTAVFRLLFQHVLVGNAKVIDYAHMGEEEINDDDVASPQMVTTMLDEELQLSFLPLGAALRFAEPPKYGTVAQHTPSLGNDEYHRVVKVFASHRWSAPDQPSLEHDWQRLCHCLLGIVEEAHLACLVLQRNDFPLKNVAQVLDRGQLRSYGPMGMEWPKWKLEDLGLVPSFTTTDESPRLVSLIGGDLARSVFYLCCRQQMGRPPNEKLAPLRSVLNHVWLWYDYCSLPQKPGRTAEELDLFRRSLARLPDIQQCMCSLSLNSDTTYFERAWCVSEWMNANHGSMFNYNLGGDDEMDEAAASACRMLKMGQSAVALIQPCLGPRQVLGSMEIAFTDEKHDDNATTICWILLNTLIKRSYLFFVAGWDDSAFRDEDLLVGRGCATLIREWLQMWIDVVHGKEVQRSKWIQLRQEMSDPGHAIPHKRLDVAVSGEDSYDAKNLLEALQRGLSLAGDLNRAEATEGCSPQIFAMYFRKATGYGDATC